MLNALLSRYRLRNALAAGGLALLGALLVLLYVVSYRNDVKKGADLVSVYVAARDIPEGTDGASTTGGGFLKKESVLRRNVVDGAISSPNQISDLAVGQPILAGQQITIRQFHSAAQQGPLANISGNLRAITIPGNDEQLLAGTVKDGDRVDVLANVKYIVKGTGNQVVTRIILRNLLVLKAPGSGSGGGLGGSSTNTNSITFALTDNQAEKLFFAVQNTTWALILRPVARPSESPESIETMQGLIADGLSSNKVSQLTAGQGSGSISSGG
jgi:pilus assembly protein CpaB